MTMKTGDKIVSPSRGDASTAIDYGVDGNAARQDFMREYIQKVYELCAQDGMVDASIVIAQSVHETSDPGPWQSHWWRERGNPAGMGVTGDPVENAQSPWFETGEEAARAQVSHLLLYATGSIDRGGLTPADDPRYQAYVQAYGHTAQATTIDGLSGKWGTDPQYATKLCQRGNAVYPGLPDQGDENGGEMAEITFGRVPFPPCEIRDIPNNTAWDDLGPRDVKSVVYHRMLGTLLGTDSWFRGGGSSTALTDYGLGVAATDGAALAGVLYRWNDPLGRRSPWASGPVSDPYGDGKKFVDIYGVNGVNRFSTALEISGDQQTPLDDASRETIIALSAYWADRYKIPWTDYPIIQGENQRSFIIWHQEICIGSGKECPFDVVMGETNDLIARTKDRLKQYQTGGNGGDVAPPPDADYPATPLKAPDVMESQGFALTFNEPNRFVALQGTSRYTYPSRDAPKATGDDIKRDRTYTYDFATEAPSGNGGKMERWLVSKGGSWSLASAFQQES